MTEFPGFPAGTTRPLMQAEGTGSSGILVMCEALGENEERDQLPLRPYAEAGSVFERALYRANLVRSSLTITNLVWYRPPRNWLEGAPWEQDAIRACQPLNDDLIAKVRPRVIVALGGLAMRELTGYAGPKQGIEMTRGFVVPSLTHRLAWRDDGTFEGAVDKTDLQMFRLKSGEPIPVVGSYHPSFLRRGSKERMASGPRGKIASAGGGTQGMALLGAMIRDLQLAAAIAQSGAPEFTYDRYTLGASLSEWHDALDYLRARPDTLVSYDFETQDSLERESEEEAEHLVREVTQVQISWRPGQALVSPWTPDLLPVLKAILELPNPKLDWNGRKFDRPLARSMGIRCDQGVWHDGMDLWHHAQADLPRGLQYATSFFVPEVRPWKHLSLSQPLLYGAYDVDMPQRIFAALKTTLSITREPHSGVSLWGDGKYGGYTGQVARLAPVLDRMTERGIPVDEDARLALDAQFTATMKQQFSAMQAMVPQSVKGLHVYKATPKTMLAECSMCRGGGRTEQEDKRGRMRQAKCPACTGKGKVAVPPSEGQETTVTLKQGKEQVEVLATWTQTTQSVEEKCSCAWGKGIRGKAVVTTPFGSPAVVQLNPSMEPCLICSNTGKVNVERTLWAKVEPFLPGSPQQVMRYIQHKRSMDLEERIAKLSARVGESEARTRAERQSEWVIPTDYKTGRETTAELELRRLANKTGDALLPLVLDYREIQKLRGTYVQGWKPGPDGRVHPSFGFKPATGQLSSESPNAQNFPQHSDLAHAMKKMIKALGTQRLVKFDWKSFHVVTGGFEAQDAEFVRIARVDMHSFLTLVGILKLERAEVAFAWSASELKERVTFHKKSEKLYADYARRSHPAGMTFQQIRDEIAKRIVFAWEFSQGARSLYLLNQESFVDQNEAERVQAELRRLFAKVDAWQDAVRLEADDQHALLTRFGFVRRFWDVYQRRPVADTYQPRGKDRIYVNRTTGQRWLLKPGDDSEAAVAFRPACDAFGIKRERMIMLRERGWDEKYGLVNEVHDAVYFETSQVDECIADVKPLLEMPTQYLVDPVVAPQGLWCATSVAVGSNMDDFEELS